MAVDFFEEKDFARKNSYGEKKGGLIGLVLKLGLAKDSAGAQKVLTAVLIVVLIATGYILFG